jgi:hypothetical protein
VHDEDEIVMRREKERGRERGGLVKLKKHRGRLYAGIGLIKVWKGDEFGCK